MTSRCSNPSVRLCLCVGALLIAAGCSSSSPSGSSSSAKDAGKKDTGVDAASDATADSTVPEASVGVPDVHPDAIIDPNDCVATPATSSENGVGGYCSPGAGQCLHAGTGGSATDCTADFGAPAHEWFCTIPCSTTLDCGGGGGACVSAPFGQFCVPTACAKALGDAQSAVVPDASDATAPHDGSAHDAGEHDAALHDGGSAHDATSDAHAHDAESHDSAVDGG